MGAPDPLRVAVVGSGPAGIYTAEALTKQAPGPLEIDVLERLPTPYGLVRYGVAPDHPSIKSIAGYLQRVLELPDVRYLGGVMLGRDVSVTDLLACYDAVVYATGAMVDRRLGIPGEDLPGSVAATDFVNWYCGHPDLAADRFTLDAGSVAVIGVGNVAVDVARILARTAPELRPTDVPEPVLSALEASAVTDIHMIGRRGPAQAKFTTKELRELGRLPEAEVSVRPDELVLGAAGERLYEKSRQIRGNVTELRSWTERQPGTGPQRERDAAARRLHVRFWLRPLEILGTDRVEGLRLERTRLDDDGRVVGTGVEETLPVGMVLRSVGYQSVPLPGVPFDQAQMTVPNLEGRVRDADGPVPRQYVTGWLKRGPTGVIGTNKSDAAETVRSLFADLAAGRWARPGSHPGAAGPRRRLDDLLVERGCRFTSYTDWRSIETAESELAQRLGRGERVKLSGLAAMLAAAGHPSSGS